MNSFQQLLLFVYECIFIQWNMLESTGISFPIIFETTKKKCKKIGFLHFSPYFIKNEVLLLLREINLSFRRNSES